MIPTRVENWASRRAPIGFRDLGIHALGGFFGAGVGGGEEERFPWRLAPIRLAAIFATVGSGAGMGTVAMVLGVGGPRDAMLTCLAVVFVAYYVGKLNPFRAT